MRAKKAHYGGRAGLDRGGKMGRGKKRTRVRLKRTFPWKRTFRTIAAMSILTLLVGGSYILSRSEVFAFTTVRVEGNRILSKELLYRDSKLITGKKHSIWWDVDLARATNLLLQEPYVQTAQVWKEFPNTVVIEIQERKPLAILASPEPKWLVDRQARVLDKVTSTDLDRFPWIRGVDTKGLRAGSYCRDAGVASAMGYLLAVDRDFRHQIQAIYATQSGTVLYTHDRIQIRLGWEDNLSAKLAILPGVLTEARHSGKKVQYVDVRYAGHPVIRLE